MGMACLCRFAEVLDTVQLSGTAIDADGSFSGQ